ncbi:hypothetical protein [Fretibacterium fastidiosum]|uniref:hypothetical protein n=1 Tax=Fretibacterium fastidiosum TaxID=651822 RepID=UPI001AD80F46|nr:hypothetical protein [Fretibacterium fastidiosum]
MGQEHEEPAFRFRPASPGPRVHDVLLKLTADVDGAGLRGGGEQQHVQLVDGDLKDLGVLDLLPVAKVALLGGVRAGGVDDIHLGEHRSSPAAILGTDVHRNADLSRMPLNVLKTNGAPPRLVQDEDTVHLLKRARFVSSFVLCFVFSIAVDGEAGQAKDAVLIVPPDLEKISVGTRWPWGVLLQVAAHAIFVEEGDLDGV